MQMTDPDHRRSRHHGNTPPPALPIPQPNFALPNHPQVSIISHYLTILMLIKEFRQSNLI